MIITASREGTRQEVEGASGGGVEGAAAEVAEEAEEAAAAPDTSRTNIDTCHVTSMLPYMIRYKCLNVIQLFQSLK